MTSLPQPALELHAFCQPGVQRPRRSGVADHRPDYHCPSHVKIRHPDPSPPPRFLDDHLYLTVRAGLGRWIMPDHLAEQPVRHDQRERPGRRVKGRSQRRGIGQPERMINRRASNAMRIAVHLARMQCHPQPHPLRHGAPSIVPADRGRQPTRQDGDQASLGTSGGTRMSAPSPRSSLTQLSQATPLSLKA